MDHSRWKIARPRFRVSVSAEKFQEALEGALESAENDDTETEIVYERKAFEALMEVLGGMAAGFAALYDAKKRHLFIDSPRLQGMVRKLRSIA